jgi:DNA-binding beta-propeller fold protein YncE
MRQSDAAGVKGHVWALAMILAAALLASGCKSSTNIAITMSPTTATVLVGTTSQFVATASNSGAVNWSVNDVANGNTTFGTVSTNGLYTAPLSVPTTSTTTTTNGVTTTTTTATPITVTATLQTDSAVFADAAVTLDSGVRVTITPTTFTMGTGETLQFSATVTGVPPASTGNGTCNADSAPPSTLAYCNSVTWTVTPTQTAPAGFTSVTSGLFTAPSTATSVVVTATSIFDATRTGSASVTIVTATPPTLTSISPTNAARGGLFQDVYLTGTSFLSTTNVFVNGQQVPSNNYIVISPGLATSAGSTVGALIHVRLSDANLATPPVPPSTVGTLTFTVGSQGSTTPIQCTVPAQCVLSLQPVRPAVVGTSPDSIPQGSGAAVGFNVNGGFFGTNLNPVVTATYGGNEVKFPTVSTTNSTRQLTVTIGGSGNTADVSTPGLYPVALASNVDPAASVVANVAVQPSYPASTVHSLVPGGFSTVGTNVGSAPAAVAINTATGMAVVANQGSNDLELIDLTKTTPAVIGFICTGTAGATLTATETPACATASGPVAVAVDNVSNLAVVSNAATSTIAVVDLNGQKVTGVVPVPVNTSLTTPAPFVPAGVGINPLNHRAIVAYQTTNAASILDLTQTPSASFPFFAGVVNVSTGPGARVAVSPRLDWALVTPGGLGSLSIVDLGRQTIDPIVSATSTTPGASRTAGIATITTTIAQNVQVGQPVLISGVADTSFNGIYDVVSVPSSTSFTFSQTNILLNNAALPNSTSGGGTISYGSPVATLATSLSTTGVAFNDQTQKAILTDPEGSGPGSVFTVLDQSSTTIGLPTNNTGDTSFNLATAVNPLANLAVVANQNTGDAFVIDPSSPSVLQTITSEGQFPVDVAIDPTTDIAVFANQGTNPGGSSSPSIGIYALGALRSVQVLQASVVSSNPCSAGPPAIFAGPTVIVCTNVTAATQTLAILGGGFTPNSNVRLDKQVLPTTFVNSRELVATVNSSFQFVPRRYSLDVADSGVVSNSTSFTIAQAVNLTGIDSNCPVPSPQAVAVDSVLDEAVVTDLGVGCNQVYLIDLANGHLLPNGVIEVGTSPQGVAVYPLLGVAVVANQGSNTASVVSEAPTGANSVLATVTLDNQPTGVAIDQDLGEALVTAMGANVADSFSLTEVNSVVSAGSSSGLTTQQAPTAVAVDSVTHFAAVGNTTSADVTVLSLNSSATNTTSTALPIPLGIAVDPCPNSTCNSNAEFVPNPNFLIAASLENQIDLLDPTTGVVTPFRVGINPTAVAYNFAASTLVTLNQLSQTMTVVDFLGKQVRSVFPIAPSNQFGVDIDSLTNLAVVVDPTNGRVLLLPLPY